ncbi:MAG: metallophosphoesterase family protein [Candidatus Aminicenantes bacterium]|nr:MAG: metallophosphoesterase family protein [Candidatus Aminicenantes bacterium]
MRYLIFSDIHSNLEAFEKLLKLSTVKEADKYLFLGDLVGYGADPDKTIALFRELTNIHSIRGNHDKVIANLESSSLFNPVAAFSAEWSKIQLSEDHQTYLKELKKGPELVDHFITICHGSTFDEDYYVFSMFEAVESFKFMDTSIGFFGHTHFPVIYLLRNEKIDIVPLTQDTKIKLDPNTRYLVNPGSIGQPRDKNPNPSFIIFDASKKELHFKRFTYNFKETQRKVREAGLPEILASRLESGI